jgi:hypothetical protein
MTGNKKKSRGGLRVKDIIWIKERLALADRAESSSKKIYRGICDQNYTVFLDGVVEIGQIGEELSESQESKEERATQGLLKKLRQVEAEKNPDDVMAIRIEEAFLLLRKISELQEHVSALNGQLFLRKQEGSQGAYGKEKR